MRKTNFGKVLTFQQSAILLSLLCLLSACGGKPVATVSNESEAIEIIDVLGEHNISADKEESAENNVKQYKITVHGDLFGEDNYAAAIQVLRDHCLPQRDPAPVESGGYIASVEAERAKIQRQLKIGIIGQLRKLPGATCVDINFVPPQDPLATVNPYPATASVTVSYKNEQAGFTEQDVKNLVAGSVPKLQPEKVQVKLSYVPIRPVQRTTRGNIGRIILIASVGLIVIFGSVFLVYFLRKRNNSTALATRADDLDNAETVES